MLSYAPSSSMVSVPESMGSERPLKPDQTVNGRSCSTCFSESHALKDTPDQILTRLGGQNPFIMFVLLAMASVWFLTALPMMVSSFAIGDTCSAENCTLTDGTVAKDFDLTGSRTAWADWATSAFLFGNMAGGTVPAVLTDKFGRRPMLLAGLLLFGVTGCAAALSNGIVMFTILRFVQGIFFSSTANASWVLSYESLPPRLRAYNVLVFGLMWVGGYCAVAPFAYFISNWRYLVVAVSVPSIMASVFFALTVPESLHFLVSHRKSKDTQRWIQRANKFRTNNPVAVDVTQLLEKAPKDREAEAKNCPRGFLANLLMNKRLVVYTILVSFIWTTDTLVYYGLSLFSAQLAGDHYLNYALLGLVEAPSYITAPMLMNRVGRKKFVSAMHAITAASLLVVTLTDNPTVVLIMWLLGKYAIAGTFTSLFAYGSEIFPTVLRNGCLGVCDFIGRFGGAFAPYIRSLGRLHPVVPTAFFCAIAAAASMLTLFLPETMNKELPDTTEQVAMVEREPSSDA